MGETEEEAYERRKRLGHLSKPECGKRYGKRRQLTCRKDKGHKGQHGRRLPINRIKF